MVFNRFPTILPHSALGVRNPASRAPSFVSWQNWPSHARQRCQPELLFTFPLQPWDMVSSESEKGARMDFLILCHSTHDILAYLREMVLTA